MQFISKTVLSSTGTDEVYIPRQVMCRKYICDNAKLMYGVIFNECLSKMESFDEKTVLQAVDIINVFCEDVELTTIANNCHCSKDEAVQIKKDLVSLVSTSDTAAYLRECKLNYIRKQKLSCYICGNGKMMYKMTDLINTIVNRTVYNLDYEILSADEVYNSNYEVTLSADEVKLLSLYNQSHSADMLNDVIDILKK